MAEKRKLEFFLLRYAPDAVKGEFVNVGLVGIEQEGTFAEVRLTRDWRRVQCIDPEVDIEWLEGLERELRRELAGDRAAVMKRVEESFSNAVQISEWKGCLTDDPATEMETLSELYLQGRRATRTGVSRRQKIYSAMQDGFEQAGVWDLGMKGIPVAEYTGDKDPLKIDFGYRVGDVLKMFHAVALKASVDPALALAARYRKMAAGMAQRSLEARLTAVVEDHVEAGPMAEIALEYFRESGVVARGVSEMPVMAEAAREELRA